MIHFSASTAVLESLLLFCQDLFVEKCRSRFARKLSHIFFARRPKVATLIFFSLSEYEMRHPLDFFRGEGGKGRRGVANLPSPPPPPPLELWITHSDGFESGPKSLNPKCFLIYRTVLKNRITQTIGPTRSARNRARARPADPSVSFFMCGRSSSRRRRRSIPCSHVPASQDKLPCSFPPPANRRRRRRQICEMRVSQSGGRVGFNTTYILFSDKYINRKQFFWDTGCISK